MVEIQQVIDDIESYSLDELQRLRSAIFDRIRDILSEEERERDFELHLLHEGIISRIPDRSKATPEDQRPAPIKIEGEPLSETIIRERR